MNSTIVRSIITKFKLVEIWTSFFHPCKKGFKAVFFSLNRNITIFFDLFNRKVKFVNHLGVIGIHHDSFFKQFDSFLLGFYRLNELVRRKTLSEDCLCESRINTQRTLTVLNSLVVFLQVIIHIGPVREVDSVLIIKFDGCCIQVNRLRVVLLLELFIASILKGVWVICIDLDCLLFIFLSHERYQFVQILYV